MNKITLVFSLIIFLILACTPKTTPLPNEYAIFAASKTQMIIIDSKNSGIPRVIGDLKEVGSYKEYIFGRMEHSSLGASGFFFLDSSSGQAKTALSEIEWLKELKAVGVPMPPERVNPSKKRPIKY